MQQPPRPLRCACLHWPKRASRLPPRGPDMQPTDAVDYQRALAQCASEPIQYAAAIQPSGYLLSCSAPDWVVRHASANCSELFGQPARELCGLGLGKLLDDAMIDAVARAAADSGVGQRPVTACAGNLGPRAEIFEFAVHREDNLVHIEIEPQGMRARLGANELSQQMIARLVNVDDDDQFHRCVAEQVRLVTGFDRVMVYRFLHDDAGDVIAESRVGEIDPYLGLRFPASDIPPQARALYLRNRIRVISDVDYRPVPLVPATLPNGRPIDLSQHALRSVSPVHLAYLRNMGVAASMSISIVVDGRLWGLIACHHRTARVVPPAVRGAADLFGMFVSMRIAARELQRTMTYEDLAGASRDHLESRLVHARMPSLALTTELNLLQHAVPSEGVAMLRNGEWSSTGRVPTRAGLDDVMTWLRRIGAAGVVSTADIAEWHGQRDRRSDDGLAGVLALPLDTECGDWLLFFRREQLEDVRWAGRPDEPFQIDASGLKVGPRTSFGTWRETMVGHARPWSTTDLRLAERLRLMLKHRCTARDTGPSIGTLAGERAQLELGELQNSLDQLALLSHGLRDLDSAHAERLLLQVQRLQQQLQVSLGLESSRDT
ncbi:GAF domain-containing protein [Lysobacter korlensis]|uniref:GAF domain-containing protein n=1 Tax=Lysobacter korlensis TaxID=553636 RepID=A0ABV6RHG3_9GAMM